MDKRASHIHRKSEKFLLLIKLRLFYKAFMSGLRNQISFVL